MPDELDKLNKTIKTLEEADPKSKKLAVLKAQRDALLVKSGEPVAPGDDAFELDMDEDELAEVATGFSKRPSAGDHAAIIGKPDLNYSASSVKIPFTIIEEGTWKGYDKDAFYPGKSKEAAFSIKNICESAGVKAQINPKTNKVFYPLMQLEGKKIMVVYKDKVGMFTGNDGIEREVTNSKPSKAKPFAEKPKGLGF